MPDPSSRPRARLGSFLNIIQVRQLEWSRRNKMEMVIAFEKSFAGPFGNDGDAAAATTFEMRMARNEGRQKYKHTNKQTNKTPSFGIHSSDLPVGL